MKTTHIYLIVISFAILLLSCTKQQAMTSEPSSYIVVPGECIASNELLFNGQNIDNNFTGIRSMVLFFKLDVEGETVCMNNYGKEDEDSSYPWRYTKFIPDNTIFESFGENATSVSRLYEETWRSAIPSAAIGLATVFYSSGMSLVADKEFAGFKAGADIARDALTYNQWYNEGKPQSYSVLFNLLYPNFRSAFNPDLCPVGNIGDPLNELECLMSIIRVEIPTRDFEEVDEDVTFTLSIPVKVGLYLTWLNDRISDPDAPFPYREETLTCTFTIHKGLR